MVKQKKKLDFELVAEYILGNICKIQQFKKEERDDHTIQFLIKSEFGRDIRYFTDHAMEWNKRYFSQEAFDKYKREKNGAESTLENMERNDQEKKNKMNDKGRKMFHDEHLYPVNQLRDELIDLQEPTLEKVILILKKSALTWITKEENKSLDTGIDEETGRSTKSYRTDPFKVYEKAGIVLVNLN